MPLPCVAKPSSFSSNCVLLLMLHRLQQPISVEVVMSRIHHRCQKLLPRRYRFSILLNSSVGRSVYISIYYNTTAYGARSTREGYVTTYTTFDMLPLLHSSFLFVPPAPSSTISRSASAKSAPISYHRQSLMH